MLLCSCGPFTIPTKIEPSRTRLMFVLVSVAMNAAICSHKCLIMSIHLFCLESNFIQSRVVLTTSNMNTQGIEARV